jgi:hypothetical protein
MQTMYHLPTLRRRERIWQIAIPVLGLCFVVFAVSQAGADWAWLRFLVGGVILLAQAFVFVALLRERRYARRMILAGQFLICPKCRYRLDGLADSGQCPECGHSYSPNALRTAWADAYGIPFTLPDTPSPPSPLTPHVSPAPPPGASTS